MRTRTFFPHLVACFAACLLPLLAGTEVKVDFEPVWGKEPLAFDSLRLTNAANQTFSVGRLDLHLSDLELRNADGAWSGPSDWAAYLSLREGRKGFTLKGVPEGNYTAMRFHVGLPPAMNAADATKRPAGHPLNPSISTLWWGWSGGYVFLAIEGGWRRPDQSLSGYSFHIATDSHLMTVELPCQLYLKGPSKIAIDLDVAEIMKNVTLRDDQNSTHSREGDALATTLHGNIERAFRTTFVGPAATSPGSCRNMPVAKPEGKLVPFTFPSYLPVPQLPGDNPLTEEGIELGRRLFHDRRLSVNHRQSCASCHQPEYGLTDGRKVSVGTEGQTGRRNAMPLFNLAWKQSFFWDGRAPSLRRQVLMPIGDPKEMHLPLEIAERRTGISRERMARALEQYLLTLVSTESKFDRVISGKEKFSESERRGFELFHAESEPGRNQRGADCFHCHGGPLFQSKPFANNGLKFTGDLGLAGVTRNAADERKFAVPSLRNVALTAPYMHDGRFASLEEVIEHYDHGVQRSETLDPNLAKHPAGGLGLTVQEKADLIAFLRTLTDESVKSY